MGNLPWRSSISQNKDPSCPQDTQKLFLFPTGIGSPTKKHPLPHKSFLLTVRAGAAGMLNAPGSQVPKHPQRSRRSRMTIASNYQLLSVIFTKSKHIADT